ncbi:MAG: enoyl-CoA hydratase/isomerase family protein, partial [Burkholderia sp.]|nr:enoyl-CoA hydratase/isomerase family protein [Burkholderia sp.]
MSTESVTIRREGALLEVVLDRPENGNLIDQAMSDAIIAALTTIDDDTKLVRIVTSGKDF